MVSVYDGRSLVIGYARIYNRDDVRCSVMKVHKCLLRRVF